MAPLAASQEVVVSGFWIPWSVEELGPDEYLIVERFGSLFHVQDGERTELQGLPATQTIYASSLYFGGYNDVSLHPDFADNGLVYLAFVQSDYTLAVGRFDFSDRVVRDFEIIFTTNAFSIGSRIAWQDSDHFFLSQGQAGSPRPEPGPQNLAHHGGKIHRLRADGSVPDDNPVFEGFPAPSSIWSYGHRDPQGLYFEDGVLYENEHGPLGGDELNIIEPGGNYGWPLVSEGLNYDGTPVGPGPNAVDQRSLTAPYKSWGLSFNMAPSGLTRLKGSAFEEWNGAFVWGSLAQRRLIAYEPEADRTSILLDNAGRVRDVIQLHDGALMILVDSDDDQDPTGRAIVLRPE